MARKKKEKQQQTNTGFIYHGQVTVSIKKNNKIISSHTYNNNGGKELWFFLCTCLAGQYTEAANNYPLKIRLYHNSKSNPVVNPPDILNDCTPMTALISANTKRDVLWDDNNKTYKTTLHFAIPASAFVQKSAIEAENYVNQIVLYNKNRGNNDTISSTSTTTDFEYTAYYLITKIESGTLVWDLANSINLNNLFGNFTILIDWQMSFTNN